MELAFVIYLIDTILSSEAEFGIGMDAAIISSIITAIIVCFICLPPGYKFATVWKPIRKPFTIIITLLVIQGSLVRLLPSRDTAYKMLAVYGVTEVSKSETVQKYAKGSLKVLDKAMEGYLGENWDE